MTIALLLIVGLLLYKIKFIKNGISDEYISIENTKRINAVFVLIVFLSHSMQQCAFSNKFIDEFGVYVLVKLGQLMVTTFLFFSGYGIYESIKKKKEAYVNSMPKKRILKTLIKFDIAVLIFFIVSYILNIHYGLKRLLWSLIGWEGVGNSNWYIFTILVLYSITYLVFKLPKIKDVYKIIIITIITILYMILISKVKEYYWYNTALCFPLGLWYSYFKEKIESVIKNKEFIYYILLIISIVSLRILFKCVTNIYIYTTLLVFAFIACIILISMKFKLKSKVLLFLGNNVFYIYIYQRIPMMILKKLGLYDKNRYIALAISFISVIIITLIMNVLDNVIKNKKVKLAQKFNK